MNIEFFKLLPIEIIEYIWEILDDKYKIFISKKNYKSYNHLISNLIPDNRMESYIRDLIRKDCIFSFKELYFKNLNHWILMTNYPYSKENVFENYLAFIKFYAQKNNSSKCLNFINENYKTPNLKLHKRKFTKNIKWVN